MGLAGLLAQSALDFLIDERCHACGSALRGSRAASVPLLAGPVDVVAIPRFRLTSRLLCSECAMRIRRWDGPILLAPRDGGDALSVRAAFVTDARLLAIVHLLKFGRREPIAAWLARAMIAGFPVPAAPGDEDHVMVPVPMDRSARRRRGFNQAESIARTLAGEWRRPLVARALVKIRRTTPQSALGRDARLVNLEGAFAADPAMVRGRRITLVDDLVTTGATVRACAWALRSAGAGEVDVVCAGYRDEAPASAMAFLQS